MHLPPRARSWTLDVRGLPLRVWELGDPEPEPGRPPVVCLHGFLDQGLTFCRMTRDRPGRWVAPDQRGFGGSGHVPQSSWYHFPDHVADVDALLDAVSPDVPVDLVGHSMGGTVAVLYAAARPERVRRLVILDGLGPLQPPGDEPVGRFRQFLDGLQRQHRHRPLVNLGAAVARLQRGNPTLSDEHAILLASTATGPTNEGEGRIWTHDPRHRVRAPSTLRPAELEPFLRAVRAPTLVLWARDGFYPEAVRRQRVDWLAQGHSMELAGSHMLTTECPDQVGDLTEAFLARTEA